VPRSASRDLNCLVQALDLFASPTRVRIHGGREDEAAPRLPTRPRRWGTSAGRDGGVACCGLVVILYFEVIRQGVSKLHEQFQRQLRFIYLAATLCVLLAAMRSRSDYGWTESSAQFAACRPAAADLRAGSVLAPTGPRRTRVRAYVEPFKFWLLEEHGLGDAARRTMCIRWG
jgi:hypothetical protein